MTFRQPLVHRWRQQKPRLAVYLAKVAHPPTTAGIPSLQSYHIMRHLPPKSDRLLGYLSFCAPRKYVRPRMPIVADRSAARNNRENDQWSRLETAHAPWTLPAGEMLRCP